MRHHFGAKIIPINIPFAVVRSLVAEETMPTHLADGTVFLMASSSDFGRKSAYSVGRRERIGEERNVVVCLTAKLFLSYAERVLISSSLSYLDTLAAFALVHNPLAVGRRIGVVALLLP